MVRKDGMLINKYRLRIGERHDDDSPAFNFYHANAFDGVPRPIVTAQEPNLIQFYSWGLVPHWVKDAAGAAIAAKQNANCRCETAYEKPSFRNYIPKNRCLIPATGFFEWRHVGKEKYPYFIQVTGEMQEPKEFFFAGIYSDRSDGNSFSMLTTEANETMQYIHNSKSRMPVILREEHVLAWLNPATPKEEIEQMMLPLENDHLKAYTISKRITARESDPNASETLDPFNYTSPDVQNLIIPGSLISHI